MIDLHAHSTRSDGRLAPTALVARAASNGASVFALTDHDTVAGLAEARSAADGLGVQLVNGVEISVTWRRRTLHVVGLGFDPQASRLTAGLAALQQTRRARARAMAAKLERAGVRDAFSRACAQAGDGQITRAHLARLVVEDGLTPDVERAFKRYLKPGRDAHVSVIWASLDETIEWLHDAGGLAVLAHPFGYRFSAAWRQRAVADFAAAGGDALEICTGTTDRPQEIAAARDARNHGLLGSVGSDFHAPEQFWLALGRLRELPRDTTPVWQHDRFPAIAPAASTEIRAQSAPATAAADGGRRRLYIAADSAQYPRS